MRKLLTVFFITIFMVSCNLNFPVSNISKNSNFETNEVNPINNTLTENYPYNTKAVEPKIVTFGSKVIPQQLNITTNLPGTCYCA